MTIKQCVINFFSVAMSLLPGSSLPVATAGKESLQIMISNGCPEFSGDGSRIRSVRLDLSAIPGLSLCVLVRICPCQIYY